MLLYGPPMSSDPSVPQSETPDLQDLVLHLNFVPTWARQPSAQSPYARMDIPESRERMDRPPRDSFDRKARGPRPGGPRRPGGDRRGDDRRRGGRDRDRDRRDFAPAPRLPVEISFIPEKVQLGAIVRQLHSTCRAFPLFYVAHLLLAKPEFHLVKIEARPGSSLKLYQCTKDGMVALDQDSIRSHILKKLLAEHYEAQEIQAEPPAGNFVCVGRCRLSGELLGPPNYHGFNERVLELHRDRYSHMPVTEYRAQVEMVRDPALVEQWKDQARKQTVYRPLGAAPETPGLKRSEAEAKFWADHGAAMVTTTNRALLSAKLAQEISEESLRTLIHDAWLRENRSPFRMALALRPAFRRMRLHLFKAGGNETYVTAIPPHPIDPSRAVAQIAAVLTLLEQHPGCTRPQLVDLLCPGQAPDSPAVSEALAPLRWLVEKGHVIEFFNGTLSLPARHPAPAAAQQTAESNPAPVEEPAPAAPAAPDEPQAAESEAPPSA